MDVLKRVPVREQDPQVRAKNFEEVCLGYNKEEAIAEAKAYAPAVPGCDPENPLVDNIPVFKKLLPIPYKEIPLLFLLSSLMLFVFLCSVLFTLFILVLFSTLFSEV